MPRIYRNAVKKKGSGLLGCGTMVLPLDTTDPATATTADYDSFIALQIVMMFFLLLCICVHIHNIYPHIVYM